ncbi:uncharacterized protein QC763_0042410 [Podospora pseudopauciseta]|uniref:Uncharacterized protein n=1 Tax=Podospora pseudopauciseta TaxID=2093780 RepID=A0ABR0HRM0_9PEZI|nr:hypothetical protein QC763_0042410 [Podospora pseudopauciseta]
MARMTRPHPHFCGPCWASTRAGVVCCNDTYNPGCYDPSCVHHLSELLVSRYTATDLEEHFEEGYDYSDYYYYYYDEYDDIDFSPKGRVQRRERSRGVYTDRCKKGEEIWRWK